MEEKLISNVERNPKAPDAEVGEEWGGGVPSGEEEGSPVP